MNIKQYKKAIHPTDTAWERKTWKRFFHWRIVQFIESIKNLIKWFPIIWKDRNWDDYYIMKILQYKIKMQRDYLIYYNRHMGLEITNRNMTWVLNLMERQMKEYYSMEVFDYLEEEMSMDEQGYLAFDLKQENLDEYLKKYKNTVKRLKMAYPEIDHTMFGGKRSLAFLVSKYNQKKADSLIWKIMERDMASWWD